MRILQIISYLYPAWSYGGPGKLVYELSCELANAGHSVEVYTTDAFDQFRRRNQSDNPFKDILKLTVFPNISNALSFRQKAFLSPGVFSAIPKTVKQFDAVHIHEIFTPLAASAAISCHRNKIPLFVSAHGTLSDFHLKHRHYAKDVFFRLFGKYFREARGFIAATKEEEKEYGAFGIELSKIQYVPNGINTAVFNKLLHRGEFRSMYGIPPTAYLLLYIGRINSLKGLDTLVSACWQLGTRVSYRLVIGGSDDGYLQELKRRIVKLKMEQYVIFPGLVSGDMKLQALADADIFVYPSPAEGFSLAILEAGAAGLPLVITNGCKFPEVERSGAGKVVDASAEGLTRGIQSFLENPKKIKPAGAAARRLVQKQYSIESMAKRLEKLYVQSVTL